MSDNQISSSGVLQTCPLPWGTLTRTFAEDSGAAMEASPFISMSDFSNFISCGVTEFLFSEMSFDK